MASKERKINKKALIISLSCIGVLLALCLCVLIYAGDYYHALDEVTSASAPEGISRQELDDGSIYISPQGATMGVIFYPGGKVENSAYIPLMEKLAENGIASVIVKMPLNLAVLGVSRADKFIDEYSDIEKWYIAGHSLGGSMACTYAEENKERLEGVILLASYSTSDITDTSLKVISIYGDCDGVLNMEKYEECKGNLPGDFDEHIIEGGNHAYFGAYGEQEGDGTPKISRESQTDKTAELIIEFIK